MAQISFNKFLGINRRAIRNGNLTRFSHTLTNFSISDETGALIKFGMYGDAAVLLGGAVLPSGLTLKSVFEFNVSQPSKKDIYVLFVVENSENHIYVGPHWNGTAFINNWLKISNRVDTKIGVGAASTVSIIDVSSVEPDFSKLSTVNGFYDGWFFKDTSFNDSGIIVSYVATGGNKTFNLVTGVYDNVNPGVSNVGISKYPIVGQGFSSGADISPVDDIIRWISRENAIIGMTGNTEQYPSQHQLWYGYINRTFGTGGNAVLFSDFWLDTQQLNEPETVVGSLTPTVTAGGNLDIATWNIFFAFEYDGFQIGPLSVGQNIVTSGGNLSYNAFFHIPFNGNQHAVLNQELRVFEDSSIPSNYFPGIVSRRITAVRLYMKKSTETTSPRFAKRLVLASDNTSIIDFTMTTELILEKTQSITDDSLTNTYLDDVGQTAIPLNFKFGASIGNHFIAAAIRTDTGDVLNDTMIASIIDGAGAAPLDNFGGSNIIGLGIFGARNITGIHVLGDEGKTQSPKVSAVIFADNDIFIISIISGTSFAFNLDTPLKSEGSSSPDSIVFAEGNLFYFSNSGFRFITAQGSNIIGEGIQHIIKSLTVFNDCVGSYFLDERVIIWIFPTDNKYVVCDLRSEAFQFYELDFDDDLVFVASLIAGGFISTDGTKLYSHATTFTKQDAANIQSTWRTRKFTSIDFDTGGESLDINPHVGYIDYESNTPIEIKLLDESDLSVPFNFTNLSASNIRQVKKFKFPAGTNIDVGSFEISIPTSELTSNVKLKIYNLTIEAMLSSKL